MFDFLRDLALSGGNVSVAVKHNSKSRATIYRHLHRNPEFARRWKAVAAGFDQSPPPPRGKPATEIEPAAGEPAPRPDIFTLIHLLVRHTSVSLEPIAKALGFDSRDRLESWFERATGETLASVRGAEAMGPGHRVAKLLRRVRWALAGALDGEEAAELIAELKARSGLDRPAHDPEREDG